MSKIDVMRATMVEAMKAKDETRRDSPSTLLSAPKDTQVDKREPLTGAEEDAIMRRGIKQTQEAYDLAPTGRKDIRRDAAARLAVCREFTPEDMSVEQIKKVIASVLEELGLASPTARSKGAVMKVLVPRVKGKADGEMVNGTLISMLNQRKRILKVDYREEIKRFIDSHREDIIEDICRLYRINSKRMPYTEGKPCSEGTFEALQAALSMAKNYGFFITNYDNYVGTTDLNDKESQLSILTHLDVVPAGEGWIETSAYEPVVKDGKLLGRSIADDKDPAVATLYTMRAVKKLRIPLNKNVRLTLEMGKKCGSSDIAYCYDKEKEAPMAFSPDAEFPVINIEKEHLEGHFHAEFKASEAVPGLVKVEAGIRTNVVPDKAKATVEGIDLATLGTLMEEMKVEVGISFSFEGSFPVFRITAQGEGAYASTPQGGKNALTGLLLYLTHLSLAECGQVDTVKALVELFPHGDTCGKAAGIAMGDEPSEAFTLAFSMLTVSSGSLESIFDSRCPICSSEDNVLRTVRKNMADNGVALENETMVPPRHVDGNSRFVKTLLACYGEYAELQGSCESTGDGIYVYHLKSDVAFRATLPDTDNRMHGADEFAVMDELVVSTKIFAQTVMELCRQPGVR